MSGDRREIISLLWGAGPLGGSPAAWARDGVELPIFFMRRRGKMSMQILVCQFWLGPTWLINRKGPACAHLPNRSLATLEPLP